MSNAPFGLTSLKSDQALNATKGLSEDSLHVFATPCVDHITYCFAFQEQHEALFLELAERFSVMVTPRDVHGVLMCRIMTQVYNTMDDFRKLADAVLAISREKE